MKNSQAVDGVICRNLTNAIKKNDLSKALPENFLKNNSLTLRYKWSLGGVTPRIQCLKQRETRLHFKISLELI